MSRETLEWLNCNTLVGFTEQRGTAWHHRADLQSDEPNHYPGPIPVEDVKRRLFDWEAVSTPLYYESPVTGGMVQAPNRQGIVRSDNGHLMGIFTDGYQPHPYVEWLINKIEVLLDDDLAVGSAGLLRDGAVAWVSVEVPETVVTPEGVQFRPHLFAVTSFDGSLATTYKRSITNVVCDNTMAAGLAEAGQVIKAPHRRNATLDIVEAREALNIIYELSEAFTAGVAELCRTSVTDAEWDAFLDAHAPLPEEKGRSRTMAENKRDKLTELWDHDVRVAPWRNSAWGVVQAVNTYTHHQQTVRGAGRVERSMLRAASNEVEDLDLTTLRTLSSVRDEPVGALAA